jgi:hypothetical protein
MTSEPFRSRPTGGNVAGLKLESLLEKWLAALANPWDNKSVETESQHQLSELNVSEFACQASS